MATRRGSRYIDPLSSALRGSKSHRARAANSIRHHPEERPFTNLPPALLFNEPDTATDVWDALMGAGLTQKDGNCRPFNKWLHHRNISLDVRDLARIDFILCDAAGLV